MTDEKQPQDAENLEDTSEDNQASEDGDKDYKAEAAKWKAIAERNKKKLEKVQSVADDETEEELKKPTESTDLQVTTVLKLQEKGFNAGDINKMSEEAQKLGVPIEKLADNETWVTGFKASIEAQKQKDSVNGATPPAGGKIITSDGKTYSDVVTNPDASEAEKQAAFEAQKQSLMGK